MSDPEVASAAAVAGLAGEVEALRRTVDPVPGRIADLARLTADLTAQVRDLAITPKPGAMPSWLVAPEDADATRELLAELDAWVAMVFLRYADAAVALPECWLWHPDIVEELLWLMHAWLAAYQGEKASVALVGDWHDRYRPGVVRRIKGLAGSCSLEVHLDRPDRQRSTYVPRRPDAVDVIAAWWADDRASRGPEHLASPGGQLTARAIWIPGLLVAVGAAVATAHGLFEVAAAAGVPPTLAWLYPLITDGLALVAYAATARLDGRARRYAWAVVVLAAGLSRLAQADYLAGGVGTVAPAPLRFGVGAWPAVAAAVVAHLLYLLVAEPAVQADSAVQPEAVQAAPAEHPGTAANRPTRRRPSDAPAGERARAAAEAHAHQHGELPTVTRLMDLADVSRGTAGDALKTLRNRATALHLVAPDEITRTQR